MNANEEIEIRVGFGNRHTYGRDRKRVVVWINGHPHAEFLGADDFSLTGELLCELKVPGKVGQRMCRYPTEDIPPQYAGLSVEGLPTRVAGSGVHSAWAVVVDSSDHKSMIAVAWSRMLDRNR